MREKQLIVIPTDSKYKAKNITWSEALKLTKTDDDGLNEIIEKGIEVDGFYIDEALMYDVKLN
jgi:hypothetical protein